MRYDVCIIGAGTEGLAAATILAKAGMKVVVAERGGDLAGRHGTREFHPGFRASPFADETAPIPAELFWLLGLGRAGVTFAPAPISLALWRDRAETLSGARLDSFDRPFSEARHAALVRAQEESRRPRQRGARLLAREAEPMPWPGAELGEAALADQLSAAVSQPNARAPI